jgi:hypothetical protein
MFSGLYAGDTVVEVGTLIFSEELDPHVSLRMLIQECKAPEPYLPRIVVIRSGKRCILNQKHPAQFLSKGSSVIQKSHLDLLVVLQVPLSNACAFAEFAPPAVLKWFYPSVEDVSGWALSASIDRL